ncbi:MAG TPA: peptidase S16 [Gammaproteobacteria bacterium]|nr:peptidase S16 [Gammaproteobacteria bacterium]
MSRGPFSIPAERLPETLPIFPLSGAVLLPFGRLPLNVFEPRYLNLVDDALGNCRLFGMVQPQADAAEHGLFRVGCAGRIVHLEESDDGRYLLALEGVCRFEIKEESLAPGGYRRARVDWSRFIQDLEAPSAITGLDAAAFLESTRTALAAQGFAIDDSTLGRMDAGTLVDLFGMQLPLSPADKQAVLEAATVAERADVMLALLRMRVPGVGARETRH